MSILSILPNAYWIIEWNWQLITSGIRVYKYVSKWIKRRDMIWNEVIWNEVIWNEYINSIRINSIQMKNWLYKRYKMWMNTIENVVEINK